MIYAKQLKMKPGCRYSDSVLEIDEIYLDGCQTPGFYKKAVVHDFVKANPGSVKVNIWPYPTVVHETSKYGEKYVRSSPNKYDHDNLLDLPKV